MKWINRYSMVLLFFVLASILPPAAAFANRANVEKFVIRLYRERFGKIPNPDVLKDQTDRLLTKSVSAPDLIFIHLHSVDKKKAEDYVATLYRVFFGREPDKKNSKYYINNLSKGGQRIDMFLGFVASAEFMTFCNSNSISPVFSHLAPLPGIVPNTFFYTGYRPIYTDKLFLILCGVALIVLVYTVHVLGEMDERGSSTKQSHWKTSSL